MRSPASRRRSVVTVGQRIHHLLARDTSRAKSVGVGSLAVILFCASACTSSNAHDAHPKNTASFDALELGACIAHPAQVHIEYAVFKYSVLGLPGASQHWLEWSSDIAAPLLRTRNLMRHGCSNMGYRNGTWNVCT